MLNHKCHDKKHAPELNFTQKVQPKKFNGL